MLTRQQRLLVKKKLIERPISLQKKRVQAQTSVFVSSPQPLHHTEDWIASFYIALFKSHNYENYVYMYAFHISLTLI